MPPFALAGKILAHAGKRDQLVEILLRAAGELEGNPGCRFYLVNVIDDEPEAVWVNELWDSRDAHSRSLEKESIGALIGQGRPLIAGFGAQVRMTPVGGKRPK